jgi:hypothetical protein
MQAVLIWIGRFTLFAALDSALDAAIGSER